MCNDWVKMFKMLWHSDVHVYLRFGWQHDLHIWCGLICHAPVNNNNVCVNLWPSDQIVLDHRLSSYFISYNRENQQSCPLFYSLVYSETTVNCF